MGRAWLALGRLNRVMRGYWISRSLAQQFAIVAAAVLMAGMAALGFWVSERIKQGIMHNSAASGALFMDSYIAPLVQDLATSKEISKPNLIALNRVMKHAAISNRVSAIKIWRPDGVIAFSNWQEKIGQHFRPTPNFLRALGGAISAEFEGQYHEQDSEERALKTPLLEIYAPVRERNTDRIIAISEFYEAGADVKSLLARAEAMTWLVVAAVTALMMAALSGIVARGSRTIENQRNRLEAQVVELKSLLDENHELSERVQRASSRTAIINEQLLRRVGADLHDGPAQLLSLALLRLDFLSPVVDQSESSTADAATLAAGSKSEAAGGRAEIEKIRGSLKEAMKELRAISAGLALPELGRASLAEVARMAVRAHERKTETRVEAHISLLPGPVPDELKTCVYRFVQEALSNAFRHAGAKGQRVSASAIGHRVLIEVFDKGPGFADKPVTGQKQPALGLSGMRDRIESLGGSMIVGTAEGGGARVAAHFDIKQLRVMDRQDG